MNSNVQINSVINTNYEDLGLVIGVTNMAAGATVTSPWYDGVQWVRNMVLMHQSDQQYDLSINVRDSTGTTSSTCAWNTLAGNAGWWRVNLNTQNNNGLIGFSVRYVLKNSSAVANTYANVKIQLLGL